MAMGNRCCICDRLYTGIKCPHCDVGQLDAPDLGGEVTRLRHDQLAPGVAKAILAAGSPHKASEAVTTGANAIQVGGTHYKASYQHWDFVADLRLDYWQACATKYVTRWRKKNGLEDLRKAPHYMLKRAEIQETYGPASKSITDMVKIEGVMLLAKANDLDAFDAWVMIPIVLGDWEQAKVRLDALIQKVAAD